MTYATEKELIASIIQKKGNTCQRPPEDWICGGHKGHEGPCAAYPADMVVPEIGWLLEIKLDEDNPAYVSRVVNGRPVFVSDVNAAAALLAQAGCRVHEVRHRRQQHPDRYGAHLGLDPKLSAACWLPARRLASSLLRRKSSGLHPHHVIYKSHQGTDALNNLITLCHCCHIEGVHGGRLKIVVRELLPDNLDVQFIALKNWKPS